MQAHLIYNDSAGMKKEPTVEALQEALQQVGFHPVYKETNGEEDLDNILEAAEGVVVAAGGDGTVRAVATRLTGRDLPLVILPMGTANNVARSLGIDRDPLEIVAGLAEPRPLSFDIGYLQAPWGEDYFLEGAGFGFFADVLATYDPEKGKSVLRSMEAIGDTLLKGHAYPNTIRLDGEELAGEFLLVEMLNTTAVGPRLKFAPDASPCDRVLNAVCIQASDRQGFLNYLTSLIKEDLDKLEAVTVRQVKQLSFTWTGFPVHVDGEVRPHDWNERQEIEETELGPRPFLPRVESGQIKVQVLPAALTLWMPSLEEKEKE